MCSRRRDGRTIALKPQWHNNPALRARSGAGARVPAGGMGGSGACMGWRRGGSVRERESSKASGKGRAHHGRRAPRRTRPMRHSSVGRCPAVMSNRANAPVGEPAATPRSERKVGGRRRPSTSATCRQVVSNAEIAGSARTPGKRCMTAFESSHQTRSLPAHVPELAKLATGRPLTFQSADAGSCDRPMSDPVFYPRSIERRLADALEDSPESGGLSAMLIFTH